MSNEEVDLAISSDQQIANAKKSIMPDGMSAESSDKWEGFAIEQDKMRLFAAAIVYKFPFFGHYGKVYANHVRSFATAVLGMSFVNVFYYLQLHKLK